MSGDDGCFLLATKFAEWDFLNLSSADLFDHLGFGTFVDDGVIYDLYVGDVDGLVDDGGVINHHRGRANGFQEVPFFDKDKRPR